MLITKLIFITEPFADFLFSLSLQEVIIVTFAMWLYLVTVIICSNIIQYKYEYLLQNFKSDTQTLSLKDLLYQTISFALQIKNTTDLYIVSVESAFPHDQKVSLRVRWAEPLLTEGQQGLGVGQVQQRWHSVRHSVWLFVEEHWPRRKIGWPHTLCCVSSSKASVGINAILQAGLETISRCPYCMFTQWLVQNCVSVLTLV